MTALRSWKSGLARLGECISEFQRMEEVLSICISAMIGKSRKVGKILTSEMSFRAKVAVFRALFIHHYGDSPLPKDILELVARLNWAEQERNTLVHSLWDASEKNPEFIRRKKTACRKDGLITHHEHITPDELEALSRLYEGITTDLIYLVQEHLPKINVKI